MPDTPNADADSPVADVSAVTPIAADQLRKLQINGEHFGGSLTKHFKQLLEDPIFRKKVIDVVNDKVNLPMLSEGTEGRLFGQAYDWVTIAIIVALDKID